jgi:hypothetical protein
MTQANLLWGAPRIHGELGKLGIAVSERTVSRLLGRRRRPPSQPWRTFLKNHVASLVSMDFFTVPTRTGRVLFVLVLLTHHRRRIVHLAISEHPTAAWTAQQIIEAFPNDTATRWLPGSRGHLRGRVPAPCRRYGHHGTHHQSIKSLANPYVETSDPFGASVWDHVIVLGERHLRRLLTAYSPTIMGREHISPWRRTPPKRRVQTPTEGRVVAFPEVGELHHCYERRAA